MANSIKKPAKRIKPGMMDDEEMPMKKHPKKKMPWSSQNKSKSKKKGC